ncbi:MAG: hypothetical protein OEV74_05805 [Cyclobacteriaceae bacterium]|nr:hypothetical protein [Cyclobacteriaceae bacterium]MDH4295774.1 hypothetical protein [Cyclobacteriaceae bacterium]MDH5247422.1 hypothetical protein [Cyclobacteriaceae bacterium]
MDRQLNKIYSPLAKEYLTPFKNTLPIMEFACTRNDRIKNAFLLLMQIAACSVLTQSYPRPMFAGTALGG